MAFLISSVWIRQEAAARGLTVTPALVRRFFERQKRAAFGSEREFARYLRESGQREADLLYRMETDLQSERLRVRVARSVPRVTAAEIDAYYASHRRNFPGMPRRAARRIIRQILAAEREQQALDRFIEDYRARYRAITTCADEYVVEDCGATASGR